jgi:hypothetical protein
MSRVESLEQEIRKLSPQEDTALELSKDDLDLPEEDLKGDGLTAEEIAKSPEIGAWAGADIESGAEYVEKLRRASPRYSHLSIRVSDLLQIVNVSLHPCGGPTQLSQLFERRMIWVEDYGSRRHPAGGLGDPKDLGDGKVRPPRSFPLAGLALRMTPGSFILLG